MDQNHYNNFKDVNFVEGGADYLPEDLEQAYYDTNIYKSPYNNFLLMLQVMQEKKMSKFDARCFLASKIIEHWMQDPDNRAMVRDKQTNYIHDKGWAAGKLFKEEHTIPQEAFLVLPPEISQKPKELMRWLKNNHRYLVFRGSV